jgi:cytoskeletal protein RodZ
MLAIGVIAVVGAIAAVTRYFLLRDDVPPMQRHARALAALRDLSEHPRPPVDLAVQPEMTIDHVRILDDATADSRRVRKPSPSRTTTRKRRNPRTRAAAAERPTIQIRASADRSPPGAALGERTSEPEPERGEAGPGPEPAVTDRVTGLPAWPEAPGVPVRAYAAAAAVVVVAVAGVIAIVLSAGAKHSASGAPATTAPRRAASSSVPASTTSSSTSTTVAAVAEPVVTVTPSGATVTAPGPFRLTLAASGPCWVQITDAGGATLFSTTMPAGRSQDIPVTRAVTLQLGNAAAMTLSVDGAALDTAGLARVTHIDFQPS